MRVVTGEGGLDLGGYALAHGGGGVLTQFPQRIEQQEAVYAPGETKGAVERNGATIQAAIDIHLLVDIRSVHAVFSHVARDGGFHAGEDVAGQASATDRVESDGRAGVDERLGQVCHKAVAAGVDHVFGTQVAQQCFLFRLADDIDQVDAVGDADAVQHLSEVRGGGA